jgi:peptide-methionine (R)-S-oxide reductase
MIDRRILLASVASLLGLAAFRWLRASPANAAEKFEIEKTDAEWRAQLTPQQYEILRKQGTERPGSSPLLKEHRKGIFACAGCDLPLFSSETKFESGTGWPSFYQPLENAVGKTEDRAYGMLRTEIHCRRCGGHLGHVFDDGRSRPACATAWTASRWCFTRPRRRRPDRPRPAIVARPAIVPRSLDRGFFFKLLK